MNIIFSTTLLVNILTPLTVSANTYNYDIKKIESDFNGRVGVYALNTETGKVFEYRGKERFPLCSSFKSFLAAAVLHQDQKKPGFLQEMVKYNDRKMEPHSPITGAHQKSGMTVYDMAKATLQYSDNGAANMLMDRYINGPEGMTKFMKGLGDDKFRLDRWELDLNSAIPGDPRDTSTPKAVTNSLNMLISGDIFDAEHQKTFEEWMIGNTTGNARIRSSVPEGWVVGDKTGTCGNYGTANDHAIIWPKDSSSPMIVSIYTTRNEKDAQHSDAVIAQLADIAIKSIK